MDNLLHPEFPQTHELFDALPAPMVIVDADYVIVASNRMFRSVTGATEAIVGQGLFDAFNEREERQALFRKAYDQAFAGETVEIRREYYGLRSGNPAEPDVTDRWWTVRISPLPGGPKPQVVAVVEDRTAEVLAERMTEAVASELRHRTANLSSLINVLVRQSARTAEDIESYSEALIDRIEALMQANRLLSAGHWTRASMIEIVDSALGPFDSLAQGRISVEGPDIEVAAGGTQGLVMGLHELATNAVKHGAIAAPSGRLSVEWHLTETGGVTLVWQESGCGACASDRREGFGTTMLTRLLPTQMQGEATRSFGEDGLRYELTIGPELIVGGSCPRQAAP